MLDGFLRRAMRWRVLTRRVLGHFTDDRLKLEQYTRSEAHTTIDRGRDRTAPLTPCACR